MSNYTPHGFTLSLPQVKKLSSGLTVRISKNKLQGDKSVFLTVSQLKRVQKSLQNGTGMDLKLSNAQLKYNVKHGFGIWDSIKNAGKYVYNKLREPALDLIKDQGKKYLQTKVYPRLQNKSDQLLSKADQFVDKNLKKIGAGKGGAGFFDNYNYGGIKNDVKYPKIMTAQGAGFFGDIFDGVKNTFNDVKDSALGGLQQGIAKRIGGRGRPKKSTKGSGVFEDSMPPPFIGMRKKQIPKSNAWWLPKEPHMTGEGFFGDVFNGLKKVGLAGLQQGIAKRIGGKRPRKVGKSITLPGYARP